MILSCWQTGRWRVRPQPLAEARPQRAGGGREPEQRAHGVHLARDAQARDARAQPPLVRHVPALAALRLQALRAMPPRVSAFITRPNAHCTCEWQATQATTDVLTVIIREATLRPHQMSHTTRVCGAG